MHVLSCDYVRRFDEGILFLTWRYKFDITADAVVCIEATKLMICCVGPLLHPLAQHVCEAHIQRASVLGDD